MSRVPTELRQPIGPVLLTAIVSTKNEELAIPDCLESLEDIEQVIVVDSGSTDATPQLVQEAGVELVDFHWNGTYPKKKQWCLDNLDIRHDWVLFIDADERPSSEFIAALGPAITNTRHRAYDVRLEYVFAGRLLKHGHTVVKRALIHRESTEFPEVDDLDAPGMGELEGHYQPRVSGSVGTFPAPLLHNDPDPVSSWITRHNKYSDWEAYLATHASTQAQIRQLRSRQGRVFDKFPGKPLLFFLYAYIFRQGYRDGRAGLDYALALTFYYWLIGVKVREGHNSARQSVVPSDPITASSDGSGVSVEENED